MSSNPNAENIKSQMRKGLLEYCILSVLEQKDSYASDIIKKLKDSELIVVEGTLYPLLMRQKNAGWLSYRWEESTQGPPRKYYIITDDGRNLLAELHEEWTALNRSVEKIRQPESAQQN